MKFVFKKSLWAVLLTIGCHSGAPTDKEDSAKRSLSTEISLTPQQIQNAGIVLASPVKQGIALEIPVSGMLDVPPQNLHSIGARVGGMVKTTSMLQGTHVHKGDILCVIENPEFLSWQQDYISNKARLELLEAERVRQEELAGKNYSSQKSLQQIQSECKITQASVHALRMKLQLTGFSLPEIEKGNFSAEWKLRAPDDGFITAVFLNSGQVLKEGDPICEMVNPEHIHAELMVFEKDVSRVKEGQKVEFSLVSDPEHHHQAEVFLVNRKIAKDRTVQVHAHLEEMVPEFLPNMQISAHIRSDERMEWVIPEEALILEGKNAAVFIEGRKAGFYRKVPVRVLLREENRVAVSFPAEIRPESVKLVVKGAYDVKSAMEKAASSEE
jgi:cobalt-zinc-cadmium efflux system membrane fusion protein